MDAAETEKLKKDYSLFDLLTGIVKDAFNWFKNDIFSFDLDAIKIPEFPNIGEIITDIFRKFALSIANVGFSIPLVGRIEFRDVLPQSFLDFADKTGQYAPPQPSSPAENYGPVNGPEGQAGGSAPIVVQQTNNTTNQGDSVSFNQQITENDPFISSAAAAVP